ncbi:30S ribosomal protein S9 [Candidatus Daviesbacteria bacterium RIFCSPHIGHO2_02_FULL_39_41]|uniref:30S ribosomal protein S9 n=1 Tax=Candidatus Daviesbacteria bacterium GW2011_GWF2_38_6 TaxID=1618432 RepID=A0A0G0KI05_9BACT|nr:MAG: 30S ribosomal protein S9 [Candidatus Daviesbacteria bacterium GW2011_GWF2_38_6]OGE27179.1 MAG: 30S ribosomal protein S9 [Candidatus Daviesbacteria bacterium RIFCSPHIGHO2_02_FULL_39_41]OGE45232.1 MAG: 30S ribosomal protein S9 [Candidatus Daviesbacteria bacterium RIFCSPHIGHO2_12_FULL_38_25]OGE72929.1 MAG: 30S ribosomal protein S9 [Candidatus Daviesbacteria bacterium RIFCSPLOWO2_12_FULL_38_10]
METLNETYTYAVGRRKESLAKVRLFLGAGQITVNGKPIAEYFPGLIFQKLYLQPFEVTSTMGKFTISIKVVGGGKMSQLGAIIHGISRVLAKIEDKKYRPLVKKAGLLTRDARVKERRKYGHAQKARAMKQSPKR